MYNKIRVKCSSIITKHREWGGVIAETIEEKEENQTKHLRTECVTQVG